MAENSKRHTGLRLWLRGIGWTIVALLLLVLLLRLSLKMGFVQNWAKDYIVTTANQQLNATLSIDRLSGDLWKEVSVTGIHLTREDTVAWVDSVHAAYNVWGLLDGEIDITRLDIFQPEAMLRQEGDHWNVQKVVPASEDTAAEGDPMAFSIDNLSLNNGSISVRSDSIPVESNFGIKDLMISSSLAFADDSYNVDLWDLSFQLENTELDQSIRVESAASARDERITLERLVLATGSSVLQSSGYANPDDSSAMLDFSAEPIAWDDITSYARDFPLREDVQIDLGLEGSPELFVISLAMQANGLDAFEASGRFQWKSGLILQQINISAEYVNPRTLLSDTTIPSLRDFNAEFSGNIDVADYQQGKGELEFSVRDISQDPYHLDLIAGKGSLSEQSAAFEFEIQRQNQTITSDIWADQIWSEVPSVKADIRGSNIDPSYWMQDTTLTGNLSFRSQISGQGWYPKEQPWQYSLAMDNSRLNGQLIDGFRAEGQYSEESASIEARLPIHEGRVNLSANLRDMQTDPAYNYDVEIQDLNVGPFMGGEDFTTAFNSKITGDGRGFDPASMQLNTSIAMDSSLVNGELIRNLSADLVIRDSVAVVDDAELQSSIAEGSFDLRFNVLRAYDADNELGLNLTLKDLTALAPLADVEDLQAEGDITGKLTPLNEEHLRFSGTMNLSNLQYNELFLADAAQGSVDIRIEETFGYSADLDLNAPSFSGVQLQNLSLITKGSYADSLARGNYELQFSSPNEGHIEQNAAYAISPDSIQIRTTGFSIVSGYRSLTLEEPFELLFHDDILRMDTMRVSSGDGAFLEMGIPILSENEQRGFIEGNALNTRVIQSSILGETYVDAMLSGSFNLTRQDTSLEVRGQMLLSEVTYDDTSFDSLLVSANIENERMEGSLSLRHESAELVNGDANLPFKLGDPEEFPDSFFREPVKGNVRIHDITIERFQSLFAEFGITESSGIITFRGQLDGTAGEPEFTADASLRKAELSGVAIDSITAGMDYNHKDAALQLDASVVSLKQKAAEINADFPLFIDMKTLQVDLPQAEDNISVDIVTNDFNLKALNDFVDDLTLREIAGRLNGSVQVKGAMEDLETDGHLELRNGAFRLVPAGIRVDNIRTTMDFNPNQIELTNFLAQSGNGNLKASGIVELEQLVPGNMDIKVRAQNFRAANTPEYNAIINLEGRAQGEVTKPQITGSLSFISGFLQLDNFGEKSVENVDLNAEEEDTAAVSLYDSLSLDMDVNFDRRFFIRNERYLEMELELAGELELQKEMDSDLELFGAMSAPNGYALPFGKEFDLEEGAVTFNGPPENPELAIRTRYEPPQTEEDIIIWYVIEGTVEDPQFRYESQPPMELENIISYTVFGQPFYALDSWQQVVAGSGNNTTAADVALDVLLDRVETLATQKLGIDVVKIDNTHVGGETGTSITTGWYINPKVFFAIQNVITGSAPDTGFLLEYMLREDLKLIIKQGNDIRQGIDLKWNYDY